MDHQGFSWYPLPGNHLGYHMVLLTIHIEAGWSNKFQYRRPPVRVPFWSENRPERFNMLDKPDPSLFEKLLFFSDFGVVYSALSL